MMQPLRTARCLLVALVTAGLCAQEDPYLEDLRAAERYASKGKRARATAIFDEILADAEDFGVGTEDGPSERVVRAARLGLFEIDFIGGDYAGLVEAIEELPATERDLDGFRWLLARTKLRVGEYDAAIEILSATPPAERSVRADCLLGEAYAAIGRHDKAHEVWRSIVDGSRRSSERTPETIAWIARAHIRLGGRDDLEQASALLVDAIRRAPDLTMARVLLGWVRYLAYGEADGFEHGETVIKKVLEDHGEVEDALLTLYRIRSANTFLDGGKTASLLERALALNPKSVEALTLRGVRLLGDRRFTEGAETLDRALAINPNDKDALAQRAAAAHVRGNADAEREFAARALALDPAFAGVDIALGDLLAQLYRFEDAVAPYERALAKDPESIDALHGLAKAAVYTGHSDRARELLTKASELQRGLVHPWRHNILSIEDLLAEEYVRVEEENFVFRIHREDVDVLREYLIPFQLEAAAVLDEKYGFEPQRPVTVEVLRTWDDFSVRTIGYRGFTALGACFGPLITLVSPRDGDLRKRDFMWTATVWHEYAHVLTLGLSSARVPRWLTEGISVYEEKQKSRTWERGMERDLLNAYHNGQIPPVRLLNRLFRGSRILFGYYQGGLIVEYLAREFGFERVLEMLRLYGEDLSQEEIFERSFGIDTATFDVRFLAYVRDELIDDLRVVPHWDERAVRRMLDRVAVDPDDVETHVKLAWASLQRGVGVDAAEHLRQIFRRDPEHAEGKLVHANLLLSRGRFEEAEQAFEFGFKHGADDFDSRIAYGLELVRRNRLDDAARQFLAAKRCWPRCSDQTVAPPVLLGKLYRKQGKLAEAMMELKLFCNLTARAFEPRLTLAEWENESGNHASEAKLLDEAVQIDPFMRSVHVRLGRALVELGRLEDAAREFRVALAVAPDVDREYMDAAPAERPSRDSAQYRALQAETCVELARVHKRLGDLSAARDALRRAIDEAPQSDPAATARELLELWRNE